MFKFDQKLRLWLSFFLNFFWIKFMPKILSKSKAIALLLSIFRSVKYLTKFDQKIRLPPSFFQFLIG